MLLKADLNGASLLGADLRGADLGGANLARADLDSASLRGANLARADLTDADLTGTNLHYQSREEEAGQVGRGPTARDLLDREEAPPA